MERQKSKYYKKTAVISGGSGYVGSAIARQLSADGFKVALLYFGAVESDVEKIIASLNGQGHKAYRCDIRDETEVNNAIKKIAEDFGEIDACIHAAESKINRSFLRELSGSQFRRQFEAGVFGGFNFMKACASYMKKSGGVIIGITSSSAKSGSVYGKMGAYVTAKYALSGLLRALAKELASDNIWVHEVAPGFLRGGLNKDLPAEISEFLSKKNDSGYPSSVENVAKMVALLCSEN